jgi:hypothetical protein
MYCIDSQQRSALLLGLDLAAAFVTDIQARAELAGTR